MQFYTGSDHGGIEMREQLSQLIRDWGHTVVQTFGPQDKSQATDYPDVASDLCRALLNAPKEKDGTGAAVPAFGLLVCGTGQGMAICANKIPGIRAGAVSDPFSAEMIRAHNNANVICLGQRVLGSELAALTLRSFIQGKFAGQRHEKRVDKINALEKT